MRVKRRGGEGVRDWMEGDSTRNVQCKWRWNDTKNKGITMRDLSRKINRELYRFQCLVQSTTRQSRVCCYQERNQRKILECMVLVYTCFSLVFDVNNREPRAVSEKEWLNVKSRSCESSSTSGLNREKARDLYSSCLLLPFIPLLPLSLVNPLLFFFSFRLVWLDLDRILGNCCWDRHVFYYYCFRFFIRLRKNLNFKVKPSSSYLWVIILHLIFK